MLRVWEGRFDLNDRSILRLNIFLLREGYMPDSILKHKMAPISHSMKSEGMFNSTIMEIMSLLFIHFIKFNLCTYNNHKTCRARHRKVIAFFAFVTKYRHFCMPNAEQRFIDKHSVHATHRHTFAWKAFLYYNHALDLINRLNGLMMYIWMIYLL